MKRLSMILNILLLILVMGCDENETPRDIKLVTAEEMHSLIEQKDVQLVDVRTPEEYNEGYIENSQNIDFNSPTFEDDILKLDKTKPVILYCQAGGRSSKCADKLKAAGFIKIFDLEGGITRWKFKGFDIHTN